MYNLYEYRHAWAKFVNSSCDMDFYYNLMFTKLYSTHVCMYNMEIRKINYVWHILSVQFNTNNTCIFVSLLLYVRHATQSSP